MPVNATPATIDAIPAFSDNYIWALIANGKLCVVDPGDAQPVIDFATHNQLTLDTILVTHHHRDHIGGIAALRNWQPAVRVIGPAGCLKAGDSIICDGETLRWQGLEFTVIAVPGHTLDHIAYFCQNPDFPQPLLFCGDTLFAGGCGRVFEGTPAQMHASLQRIATLPATTQIYCAHEYTLSNLRFALAVEPDNAALQQRQHHDRKLRDQNQPTVPSSLQTELETNPFLRCHIAAVRQAAAQISPATVTPTADDSTVFAALREWKNRF